MDLTAIPNRLRESRKLALTAAMAELAKGDLGLVIRLYQLLGYQRDGSRFFATKF